MKFEYKIISLSNINNRDSHDLDIYENKNKQNSQQLEKGLHEQINSLGKEGWELVSVYNNNCYFKRAL